MCGKNFWKGVIVFCLAFGFGAFVPEFFISKDLPAQKNEPVVNSPSTQSNCVPVDKNLKYETAPLYKEEFLPVEKEKPTLDSRELVKKSESKKTIEKEKTEEVKKEEKPAKSQPDMPSKDSAEYQILLYKEKCFEALEQK